MNVIPEEHMITRVNIIVNIEEVYVCIFHLKTGYIPLPLYTN